MVAISGDKVVTHYNPFINETIFDLGVKMCVLSNEISMNFYKAISAEEQGLSSKTGMVPAQS